MTNLPIATVSPSMKGINLNQLPPEAWHIVTGGEPADTNLRDAYSQVSWAFRAVDMRANAVASMPFGIFKGRRKIDQSGADYENKLGFLPNPGALFGLLEAALTVWGYAYLENRPNLTGSRPYSLRYLLPTSVTPVWGKDNDGQPTGEVEAYERHLGSRKEIVPAALIARFWKPDPFVELGPPRSSPMQAAAADAGVLLNLNKFAAGYFERGAIKATLLAVDGNPPETEKERIKSTWQRVMTGLRNAFGEMVINAKSVTPVVVGEGLDALSDAGLSQEKRESIAAALGIPFSKLFSSSASGLGGGGVAVQDDVTFYRETIIPDCRFIEACLNEQVFAPLGYRLRFLDETLDMFQVDETERAQAITSFLDFIANCPTFELAEQIAATFGYELSDEMRAALQTYYADKEADREQMQEQLAQPAAEPQEGQPPQREQAAAEGELRAWRRKALRMVKSGRPAAFAFECEHVSPGLAGAISGALDGVTTAAGVNAVFDDVWRGYP